MNYRYQLVFLFLLTFLFVIIIWILEGSGHIDLDKSIGAQAFVNLFAVTIVGFLLKRAIDIKKDEDLLYEKAVKNYNKFKQIRRKLRAREFNDLEFQYIEEIVDDFEIIQLEFEEIRDTFKINKAMLWWKRRKSITTILNEMEDKLRRHTRYLQNDDRKIKEDKDVFKDFYENMIKDNNSFLKKWDEFQEKAYGLKKDDTSKKMTQSD